MCVCVCEEGGEYVAFYPGFLFPILCHGFGENKDKIRNGKPGCEATGVCNYATPCVCVCMCVCV